MFDQRETSAIDKAKFLVVVSCENRSCRVFDGLAHAEDLDLRLIETLHESNRRFVTHFEADQSVGFGKDEIRC